MAGESFPYAPVYLLAGEAISRAYLEYSVEALPLPILPIQLVQGKIKKEVREARRCTLVVDC